MLLVEADTPRGWCVRNVITGEYRARRFTREAADELVDEWVRANADQIVARDNMHVETPEPAERWQASVLQEWAHVDGRWWAYTGQPRRWVPAELVRRVWATERKKR